MKVPMARVEVKVQWLKVGSKTLPCNEVRKYPEDKTFAVIVSETDMSASDIGNWLVSRGWYYAGHKGGVLTWAAKPNSLPIMVDTAQVPPQYR